MTGHHINPARPTGRPRATTRKLTLLHATAEVAASVDPIG
jgi:hypothetical protein